MSGSGQGVSRWPAVAAVAGGLLAALTALLPWAGFLNSAPAFDLRGPFVASRAPSSVAVGGALIIGLAVAGLAAATWVVRTRVGRTVLFAGAAVAALLLLLMVTPGPTTFRGAGFSFFTLGTHLATLGGGVAFVASTAGAWEASGIGRPTFTRGPAIFFLAIGAFGLVVGLLANDAASDRGVSPYFVLLSGLTAATAGIGLLAKQPWAWLFAVAVSGLSVVNSALAIIRGGDARSTGFLVGWMYLLALGALLRGAPTRASSARSTGDAIPRPPTSSPPTPATSTPAWSAELQAPVDPRSSRTVHGILAMSARPVDDEQALLQQMVDQLRGQGHAFADDFLATAGVGDCNDDFYVYAAVRKTFESHGGADLLDRTESFPFSASDGDSGRFFVLFDRPQPTPPVPAATAADDVATAETAEQAGPGAAPPAATTDHYVQRCLEPAWSERPDDRTFRSDPALAEVSSLVNARDFSSAATAAERLAERFGDLDLVYNWWSRALAEQGRVEEAGEVLLTGLQRSRRKFLLCRSLGEAEAAAGDVHEAVYWWTQAVLNQEVLEGRGREVGTYLNLAAVAAGLGQGDVAALLLDRVDEVQAGQVRLTPEAEGAIRSLATERSDDRLRAVLSSLRDRLAAPNAVPQAADAGATSTLATPPPAMPPPAMPPPEMPPPQMPPPAMPAPAPPATEPTGPAPLPVPATVPAAPATPGGSRWGPLAVPLIVVSAIAGLLAVLVAILLITRGARDEVAPPIVPFDPDPPVTVPTAPDDFPSEPFETLPPVDTVPAEVSTGPLQTSVGPLELVEVRMTDHYPDGCGGESFPCDVESSTRTIAVIVLRRVDGNPVGQPAPDDLVFEAFESWVEDNFGSRLDVSTIYSEGAGQTVEIAYAHMPTPANVPTVLHWPDGQAIDLR